MSSPQSTAIRAIAASGRNARSQRGSGTCIQRFLIQYGADADRTALRHLCCDAEASLVGLEPLIVNLKKKVTNVSLDGLALPLSCPYRMLSSELRKALIVGEVCIDSFRRYGGSTSRS